MISTALAFALALGSPAALDAPQQKSLFQQLGITPTGNNGYEDFLLACDEYQKSNVRDIVARALANPTSPNYLQLCRTAEQRGAAALQLLKAGNGKPVRDPRRSIDMLTLFPELSLMKELAKLATLTAHAKLADGNTAAAVDDLLSVLEMNDSIGRFTLIGGLVGIASDRIIYVKLADSIGQWNFRTAGQIEQRANTLLAKPNFLVDVIRAEIGQTVQIFTRELPASGDLTSIFEVDDDSDEGVKRLAAEWKAMSQQQRSRVAAAVAEAIRVHGGKLAEIASGPEKDWRAVEPPEYAGMEGQLLEAFAPAYSQVFAAAAVRRTQLRLLRLHAAIEIFRFEHDQYPETLSKLRGKEVLAHDPLAGEPFAYERTGRRGYRLSSKGSEITGRIELDYRRPLAEPAIDPNLPPKVRLLQAYR